MAQTNLFFACVFFMLIFSQGLQSVDGKRHLKLERKHKLSKLQISNKFEKEEKNFIHKHNVHGDNDSDVELPQPASFVPADAVVVGEPQSSPPPPAHVDDFRPTAPGHSPGVGHSIQN
ncbi:hypothetical protein MANES_13G126600v8 [Manihot esculenta]|uniref:Uncharacterized protein n=1 Tax=Manihot esculenta TaxID=3983 RepID=A0ACB7GNE2_MANES|nr:hypothetical protein MANES_13G126600v8 [Manihot esculenta]